MTSFYPIRLHYPDISHPPNLMLLPDLALAVSSAQPPVRLPCGGVAFFPKFESSNNISPETGRDFIMASESGPASLASKLAAEAKARRPTLGPGADFRAGDRFRLTSSSSILGKNLERSKSKKNSSKVGLIGQWSYKRSTIVIYVYRVVTICNFPICTTLES